MTDPSVPAHGSAPEIQRMTQEDWLKHVYQGDHARQLSVRSIVTGMALGGIMSISNLYVGLKTGWGMGVTITACILAFSLYKTLEHFFPRYRNDPFTLLENYTMSSAASAAGYMSSSGLVSAFPALIMTTGRVLTWWELMIWVAAISFLGVFMAIPLKRQLINEEQLTFPEGIATAETLKSMHAEGAESLSKARSLIGAATLGGLVKTAQELGPLIASLFRLPETSLWWKYRLQEEFSLCFWSTGAWGGTARRWLKYQGIGFEGSTMMLAAGAIMGIRVGLSLLLGVILFFGVIGQQLIVRGIVKTDEVVVASQPVVEPNAVSSTPSQAPPSSPPVTVRGWTLWPATSLLVVSGLLSFAFRWKTILKSLTVLSSIGRRGDSIEADRLAAIEIPTSWFLIGVLIPGAVCVWMGHAMFQIRWDMGILAVLVTFLLSIVAARATGETGVTPIGAMGKITQLMYGVLAPTNMTTNIMTASITSGAASHSADLLNDLKTGYLLGGNPRKQTISQLFGVCAGTLIAVPAYLLIVKIDPVTGKDPKFPIPSAEIWASVAKLLANGIQSLPPGALYAMIVGGGVGALLACGDEFLPAKYRRWLPSATGLGIAGVVPGYNSISMALGAVIAWVLARLAPKFSDKYTIIVSSGLIAGESLFGVGFAFLREFGALVVNFFFPLSLK